MYAEQLKDVNDPKLLIGSVHIGFSCHMQNIVNMYFQSTVHVERMIDLFTINKLDPLALSIF